MDNNLEVVGIDKFIENLPGYKPQNLTMNFMITFLFVISATVIGVFLYVITLQKKNLFGVLKAQGFTNGFLMKMVLAQTFILALIGTLIGLILPCSQVSSYRMQCLYSLILARLLYLVSF